MSSFEPEFRSTKDSMPDARDPEITWVLCETAYVSFVPLIFRSPGLVAVRDGKIAWTGTAPTDTTVFSGAVYDLSGLCLIPGLFDSHAHLSFDAGSDPIERIRHSNSATLRSIVAASAAEFLRVGVTTVRDLGSPGRSVLSYRDHIAEGILHGPTIYSSGPPLTRRRGHLWSVGREVSDVDGARDAIQDLVEKGADLCKVMVTGGRMTMGTYPDRVEFDPDLLGKTVSFAHDSGLKVAAHALSTVGIEASIRAKVDTIEHCTFINDHGEAEEERDVYQILDDIAAAEIAVCPTLIRESDTPHPISFNERARWVRSMVQHGVTIISGHDTGIPGVPPGDFGQCLTSLHDAGLPSAEVLHASTEAPASAIEDNPSAGTLNPGQRADLIAIGGDPIDNLDTVTDVRFVMSRGIVALYTKTRQSGRDSDY